MDTFSHPRDRFRSLSDDQTANLASEIAEKGFVSIDSVFSDEEVAHARAQASDHVAREMGEYGGQTGCEGLDGRILKELSSSPTFLWLCHRLCQAQGAGLAPGRPAKQVLRCLSGLSGTKHSFYFHYDSFALTALVPIVIPIEGRAGDLLMFPNFRRRRASYLVNILEKFLLDSRPAQAFVKRRALSSKRVLRLKLQPGNIYFFNGSRSLHANEDADPGAIRATLLIHYGETHADHWIRRMRRWARRA